MLGYSMSPMIIKEFDIGRPRGLVEVSAVTGTVLLDVKFLDKHATVQRTDYPSDTSIRPGQKVNISGGALVGEDEFPDWTMTCEVASAEVYVPAT